MRDFQFGGYLVVPSAVFGSMYPWFLLCIHKNILVASDEDPRLLGFRAVTSFSFHIIINCVVSFCGNVLLLCFRIILNMFSNCLCFLEKEAT